MCLGSSDCLVHYQVFYLLCLVNDSDRAENAGGMEERGMRFDKIVGNVVDRWNMGLSQVNEGMNLSGLIKLLGADRVGDYICTSISRYSNNRPPRFDTRSIRHGPRRRRPRTKSATKPTPPLVLASPRILLPN